MARLGHSVMGIGCWLRGEHDWFPNLPASEFLCLVDRCLRCHEARVIRPTGMCMWGHPLAWHYDFDGNQMAVGQCLTPK